MKKTILIIASIVFGNLLFSQSIQGILPGITYDNTPKQFKIFGYKTHFNSADSNYVSFYNEVDTVDFWITYSYQDYFLYINFSTNFQDTGLYHLKLYNSIDDTMYMDSAIQVISGVGNPFCFDNKTTKMVSAGVQEEIILKSFYITSFLPATNHSCYFLNTKNDTIQVDSITPLSQYSLKVFFTVPNNYHGLFSTIYNNSIDTLIGKDNILVMNDSKSQIAEITPDSIHNMYWESWKITIYGDNTHFTQDTNYILSNGPWFFDIFIDSVEVINDTTIKFNVLLPMACKGASYPNTLVYVYNEVDGIMFYPIRVDLYGSIPETEGSKNNLKIYPNPTHDKITIDISNYNQEIVVMEIYNLEGKKIMNTKHRTPNAEIDVSNWKPGIYFGKIIFENGESTEFKFVIN